MNKHNHKKEKNPMYGKQHSEKTKKLMSKKTKEKIKRDGHPNKGLNKNNSERNKKTSKTLKKLYASGKAKCGFKKGYIPANKIYFDNRHAYVRIAFENLPKKCNRCKNKDVRILMVHHKDRNKKNNILKNLEILCYNCHALEHFGQSKNYYKNKK